MILVKQFAITFILNVIHTKKKKHLGRKSVSDIVVEITLHNIIKKQTSAAIITDCEA